MHLGKKNEVTWSKTNSQLTTDNWWITVSLYSLFSRNFSKQRKRIKRRRYLNIVFCDLQSGKIKNEGKPAVLSLCDYISNYSVLTAVPCPRTQSPEKIAFSSFNKRAIWSVVCPGVWTTFNVAPSVTISSLSHK